MGRPWVAARFGWRHLLVAALACVVWGAPACRKDEPAEARPEAVAPPSLPTVTDAEGPYRLRYFSPLSGELVSVKKPGDVPAGARAQVLVAPEDPALQGPWLFVADLSRKDGEAYSVEVVDRYRLEAERKAAKAVTQAARQAAGAPKSGATAAGTAATGDGEVVLYGTKWCGYCKKARSYLQAKGVAFKDLDVEEDPGARADLERRAQAAGVDRSRLQGVPILWIKGKILNGFDRGAIDQALGS